MSTKDTFENMAKNTWLAGLGTISSSKELIEKSIDSAQEKSNALYNDLLSRGEEVQGKIEKVQQKFKETGDEMSAKGLKLFGLKQRGKHDEKIAELNAKVETLSSLVEGLVEKRQSNEAVAKPAKKTTATRRRAAPKTDTKAKAVVKPKTTRTRKTATKATTTAASKSTTAAKADTKKS